MKTTQQQQMSSGFIPEGFSKLGGGVSESGSPSWRRKPRFDVFDLSDERGLDVSMVEADGSDKLHLFLNAIVASAKLQSNDRIAKLIEIGRDCVGLSCATLCSVEKDTCSVVKFVAPLGNVLRDVRFPLSGSFVEKIIGGTEDIQIISPVNYPSPYHPLYPHTHPVAVIGCKIQAHGKLLGVLDFSSAFRKEGQFQKADLATINLIANLIAEIMYSSDRSTEIADAMETLQSESIARKSGDDKYLQLENMVRTVAHEYNNILVAIMGSCDLAMMDLPEDSEVQKRLILIQRSAQRAADLTEKLISSAAESEPKLSPLDFSSFVRSVVAEAKEHLPAGVRLEFQEASNLPQINGDNQQLRKVIFGVINNSIDVFEKRGGLISVFTGAVRVDSDYISQCRGSHTFTVGDYLYIKISDNGGGINREMLPRVFDPSFSLKVGSKGISLSDALEVVVNHGGAIDFSSTSGVGTTVKMLFPILRRTEEGELPQVHEVQSADDGSGVTVLIVDDEESVCLIAEEILRKTGYRTLQARNGVEAIDTFQTYADDISVAILDLTMPDMTGLEVYERFRSIRPDIPVIIASGYHKGAVISEFVGKPYLDFVHKPFAPHELVDRVKFSMRKKVR